MVAAAPCLYILGVVMMSGGLSNILFAVTVAAAEFSIVVMVRTLHRGRG
jgi:hypothetical protein